MKDMVDCKIGNLELASAKRIITSMDMLEELKKRCLT